MVIEIAKCYLQVLTIIQNCNKRQIKFLIDIDLLKFVYQYLKE